MRKNLIQDDNERDIDFSGRVLGFKYFPRTVFDAKKSKKYYGVGII